MTGTVTPGDEKERWQWRKHKDINVDNWNDLIC